MDTPAHISSFLTLPLELREEIYKIALVKHTHSLAILQTCREIYTEARKFLYQRPLSFRNQDVLYAWLANTPVVLLDQVSEISLYVQDVDLKPILTSMATNTQSPTAPRLMTWDLYQAEIDSLGHALTKLPKIKTFTLRAPSCQQSFLYRQFVARILERLSPLFPKLRDLRLNGSFHRQELAFLSNLTHLESFSFDGFSASSPSATVAVLSKLSRLEHLSLIWQHTLLTPNVGVHSNLTAKQQSFTGDVMRSIRQLASFTVTERTLPPSPALFFTSEVLSSLHKHEHLRSLSVHLSYTPDNESLKALGTFLDKGSIDRLELDWPNLRPTVLDRYKILTRNLKVLWVRANNEADAFKILWVVVEFREAGHVRKLDKLVLMRSMEASEDTNNTVYNREDKEDSELGRSGRRTCTVSVTLHGMVVVLNKSCPVPGEQSFANLITRKVQPRAMKTELT